MKFSSPKYSFRACTLLVAVAACLTVSTPPARADTTTNDALLNVDLQFASGGYVNDEVGFGFRSDDELTITALGFWNSNSVPVSYSVQILDADGSVLASATLSTSSSTTDPFIFADITPVTLPAGTTNFVTCYDADVYAMYGTKLWVGSGIDETEATRGTFDVGPGYEYLGACVGTAFPYDPISASVQLVGPNFKYYITPALHPSMLHISMTESNTVRIVWPAADTEGQLQATFDLTGALTNVMAVPAIVGTNHVVELPMIGMHRFFLLHYP
jgi:hypothetical protein